MTGLAGKAFVAIWHDVVPEGKAEFSAWHTRQHMPERLGVTGFLRGRRYLAEHGTPEYFNLYETTTTAVLAGRPELAHHEDVQRCPQGQSHLIGHRDPSPGQPQHHHIPATAII